MEISSNYMPSLHPLKIPKLCIFTIFILSKDKKKTERKIFFWLKETHLETRDTYRLKVKGWKKIFHANRDQKKAGVAILT